MLNPYSIQQLDSQGRVVLEEQVVADSCTAATRQLKKIHDSTHRIVIVNDQGEKAGEMTADYWRNKRHR